MILAGDLFGIMLKFKEIVSFLSTKNVVYGILPAKNTLANHGYRLVHTLDGVA